MRPSPSHAFDAGAAWGYLALQATAHHGAFPEPPRSAEPRGVALTQKGERWRRTVCAWRRVPLAKARSQNRNPLKSRVCKPGPRSPAKDQSTLTAPPRETRSVIAKPEPASR